MNLLAILTVYLFSYFVGEKDSLHLAWSNDGYHWTPLAGNVSLLIPQIGEDKLLYLLGHHNPGESLSFPEGMRHGTAFYITDKLFNTLQMNLAIQQRHSVRHYKDAPDAAERTWYFGEKIVLAAQAAGLNTCWVAGSYNLASGYRCTKF